MSGRMFTCPRCNGEFSQFAILILRAKEYLCPHCDAVLRAANREEILRRMKAYQTPGVISGTSYIAYSFIMLLLSIGNRYLVVPLLLAPSPVVLTVLIGSAIASERLTKNLRLEVARIRNSCKNCGYIISVGNPSFCPRCGSVILPEGHIHSSFAKQIEMPEAGQESYPSRDFSECAICGKGVKRSDASAQCPGCGGTFHRVHMLEYLHVHGRCPSCLRHLNEDELILEVLPEATGGEGGR